MPSFSDMQVAAQKLTRKQKMLYEYMMQNPEAVCYITIRELSSRVGMTDVSILRMCRNLGFEGFVDLKKAFRKYTSDMLRSAGSPNYLLETFEYSGDDTALMRSILEDEAHCFNSVSNSLDIATVSECAIALSQAREVLVFGHDVSKVMGDYFTHRLNYLRINAISVRLSAGDVAQNGLTRISDEDVIVLFSFPPYFMPVANIAKYAVLRGARVILITDSNASPVAKALQNDKGLCLYCNTKTKYFFNSLTAPVSLIGMLTECIAARMGKTFDDILQEELRVSSFINGDTEDI